MRRFWTMLAHYHGQSWNASELARARKVTIRVRPAFAEGFGTVIKAG